MRRRHCHGVGGSLSIRETGQQLAEYHRVPDGKRHLGRLSARGSGALATPNSRLMEGGGRTSLFALSGARRIYWGRSSSPDPNITPAGPSRQFRGAAKTPPRPTNGRTSRTGSRGEPLAGYRAGPDAFPSCLPVANLPLVPPTAAAGSARSMRRLAVPPFCCPTTTAGRRPGRRRSGNAQPTRQSILR